MDKPASTEYYMSSALVAGDVTRQGGNNKLNLVSLNRCISLGLPMTRRLRHHLSTCRGVQSSCLARPFVHIHTRHSAMLDLSFHLLEVKVEVRINTHVYGSLPDMDNTG